MSKKFYQVGGALSANAYSYIKREADDELYNHLKEGDYCYILNARQVGKSSLRVACSRRLEEDGFRCVHIDLTSFGSTSMSEEEWYFSFVYAIVRELNISEDEFMDFWDANIKLALINRFELAIERLILKSSNKKMVIFIDEIDFILSIKKFNTDEFFAIIRRFYNLRAEKEDFQRVSFALFGVASPQDLIKDSKRTPFNIAQDIQIHQFKLGDSLLLLNGLKNQIIDKKNILEKVFEWTSGTPYLTQKILDYITKNPIKKVSDIDTIVDKLFIEESSNEIHIQTVQGIILNNRTHNAKMLFMIAKILDGQKITHDGYWRTMIYLKLSGLIKVENNILVYSNKIYQSVFNSVWINGMIESIDKPIAKDLQQWLVSNRSDEYLLMGENLKKIESWAIKRDDLSGLEHTFLTLSIKKEEIENEKIKSQEKQKKSRNIFKIISVILIIICLFLIYSIEINIGQSHDNAKLKNQVFIVQQKNKEIIQLKLKEFKEDINPQIEEYQDYNISQILKEKDTLKLLIENSIRLAKFDKNFWLSNIINMSKEQAEELFNILKYYAYIDKADYFLTKDNFKKAIEYYTYATKVKCKKSKNAYIEIAKIYYQLEKYDNAIEFYNKIKPKGEKEYFRIGEIYLQKRDYNSSIEYYNKILESNPKNEKALFAKGAVYIEMQKYQKAIDIYNQIIKLNPKNDRAYTNIADLYFANKQYKEAINYYQKAIDISPKTNLIISRDLAFKKLKNMPYDIKDYYQKGLQSNKVGNYTSAIKYLEKAKGLNSKNYKIYNALGESYCKVEDFPKALSALKKSYKLNKKDAKVYKLKGNVHYKLKQYRKAIKDYQKVIRINPKNQDIDFNLYSTYIAIFNNELISFNEIRDEKLEKSYVEYFKNKKKYFAYYEALKILEEIYKSKDNQKEKIDNWLKKYANIILDIKDLNYLHKEWITKVEDNSLIYKLESAFKRFENNIPNIEYVSFVNAIKEAKKENKIVMVFVYKTGCPWCNKLEQKLQENEKIKRIIYANFKVVKVDKNNIPMNQSLKMGDIVPTLLFFEPKNKELIRKYSSLYNVIDILYTNLKEDVLTWKKIGYLKRTLKDEIKAKFSREGWVYLGKYIKREWKISNFRFDKNIKPDDVVDTFISARMNLNVRTQAKVGGKHIASLKIGDEVQVKKIRKYKTHIWAKIGY